MSSIVVPTVAPAAVVDASAFVEIITKGRAATALQERLRPRTLTLHAPALVDLEVLHTLRRNVLGRSISIQEAEAAIAAYRELDIERYPHDVFIERIWQLRANLSAYDAAYVALAEMLRAPLLTLDARLAKAAPPTVRVELFT